MRKWDHKCHSDSRYNITDKSDMLLMNLRDINHIMRSLREGRGSQNRILTLLLEERVMTQKKLTEYLGIRPGSVSEVLSKLEKGDLITRTENPRDRRMINITLTDQGKMLAEEAARERRERHQEMFSCLSEKEIDTLLGLLKKVNDDWRGRYGNIE